MGKATAGEDSITEPLQLGAGGAAAGGCRRVGGAGHAGVGGVWVTNGEQSTGGSWAYRVREY
eukprot:2206256-Pleurochrysis_carterae.AAC.1